MSEAEELPIVFARVNNHDWVMYPNCKVCGRTASIFNNHFLKKYECEYCSETMHQIDCRLHISNGVKCTCEFTPPEEPPEKEEKTEIELLEEENKRLNIQIRDMLEFFFEYRKKNNDKKN